MTARDEPLAVVVEDERDLADLYATWLGDRCAVETVHDGATALDVVDDRVDVVVLDRRMPGCSGDEVVDEIRDHDLECAVAMVTAVEPDFDVVDMGFDDYLVKPVSGDDLVETVDELLDRLADEPETRRLQRLLSKKALLDAEKSDAQLASSEAYRRLLDRIDELR